MHTTFSKQHQDLIRIGSAIIECAGANTQQSLVELAGLRLALSKAVQEHVTAEVGMIQNDAAGAADAGANAILRKYHDELLAWRRLLIECNAKWPLKAISADPVGFICDYKPLYEALKERVRWEEQMFYPVILSKAHLRRRAA